MEDLIKFIYTEEEAITQGQTFMQLVEEISKAYNVEELTEGTEYCSSCALESFPETLRTLNYTNTAVAGDPDWVSLALCLADCGISCRACCCFVPQVCVACIVVCTASCYYMSTATTCVAHYSYEKQMYVVL